jgi:hypothetical protein
MQVKFSGQLSVNSDQFFQIVPGWMYQKVMMGANMPEIRANNFTPQHQLNQLTTVN